MGWLSDTWKEITSGGKAETKTYNSKSSSSASTTTTTKNKSNDSPPAAQAKTTGVGSIQQDSDGNWYETVQIEGTNALGRNYAVDTSDNAAGPDLTKTKSGNSNTSTTADSVYSNSDVVNKSVTLKSGDTLSAIALANNTTVADIAAVNGIPLSQVNNLSAGLDLVIPANSKSGDESIYTGLPTSVFPAEDTTTELTDYQKKLLAAGEEMSPLDELAAANPLDTSKAKNTTVASGDVTKVADPVSQYDVDYTKTASGKDYTAAASSDTAGVVQPEPISVKETQPKPTNELSAVEKILVETHGWTDNGDGTLTNPYGGLYDYDNGGAQVVQTPSAVDTSAKDADMGVGMSPVTVTAEDLSNAAATEGTADATTMRLPSSGGGGVTLANDLANTRVDNVLNTIAQTGDVEGTVDSLLGIQPGSEFNPIQLDEIAAEVPQSLAEQILLSLKTTGLGDLAAGLQGGASALDLGSSRLGAYEVINPATGRKETVYSGGKQATDYDTARTAVAPAVKTLQDLSQAEYEKIDPAVRQEMEASRFTGSFEDLMNLEFPTAGEATTKGVALNAIGELADIGKDIGMSFIPGVGLPMVAATSFAEGAGSATQEIDAKIDQMLASGQLQQDPRYIDAVASTRDQLLQMGVDPGLAQGQAENAARESIRMAAYGEGIVPAGTTAAAADTFLAGLASPATKVLANVPKVIAVPAATLGGAASEGTTEAAEQALTNRAMIEGLGATDVTLGQNVGGAFIEAALPGGTGAGGVRALTPSQTGTTQYVPSSATAGQVAQAPAGVTSAYQQAAETMGEAGVSGVGDVTPDNITLAEQLMNKQLEDEGAIDVTELDGLGLTLNEVNDIAERVITNKMDSDNQMLQALADESVLNTGGIDADLVEEINDKLGAEAGAQVVDNAFNRPFVSNEGKTRMDIMLENAAKAGQESVVEKPATGIETVLGAVGTGPETEKETGFDTEQQLELLLEPEQEQQLEFLPETEVEVVAEPEPEVVAEPETEVVAEPETEVEVVAEPEPTTEIMTTVDIPPVIEEPEEPEVVVEPEPEPEPEVIAEPELEVLVPPTITTDSDGNTVTECPEGYVMVETADGQMCQKSVSSTRQRAGASTRAYTGLAGNVGRSGPGQKRKVTTSTRRVAPTTRRV